jgi:alkyl hydroperoxide reductase subunit F
MKQLAIIGGGPAGISASIYAARKKMDFVLIAKEVGGQVIKGGNIENYLGYAMVDGIILVEKMMEHMRKLEWNLYWTRWWMWKGYPRALK